jgi:Xaa-Pro aminopeptidase
VHAIERHNLDHLPGSKLPYAGRTQLESGLKNLLAGLGSVAMEYSPGNAIPYVSRVDAGTIELVREAGVGVVTSGDLVQRFDALWDQAQIASHREASEKLYRIKDRAFDEVTRRLRNRVATTEFDIQQLMVRWFEEEGLTAESAPNVSAQENAGNPHYLPTAEHHRAIRPNELLLLDLWGKRRQPRAVYADITWVGFTGTAIPERMTRAFAAVVAARDAARHVRQDAVGQGAQSRVRNSTARRLVIEQHGYAAAILPGRDQPRGCCRNGATSTTTDARRAAHAGSGFTIRPASTSGLQRRTGNQRRLGPQFPR